MTDDLISRAEAMDASEKFIKDCNPDHFVGHQKFIEYMDNAEIGSFGKWQFANGFNMGLTAAEVAIKNLPSAQPEPEEFEWCNGCKEHDQEKHCCHRWTKVIRKTVAELKQSQWIPCSERMPKYEEKVLVWYCDQVRIGYLTDISKNSVWTLQGGSFPIFPIKHDSGKFVAWMPLPEPYEVDE